MVARMAYLGVAKRFDHTFLDRGYAFMIELNLNRCGRVLGTPLHRPNRFAPEQPRQPPRLTPLKHGSVLGTPPN